MNLPNDVIQYLTAGLVVCLAGTGGCNREVPHLGQEETQSMPKRDINQVKEAHTDELMKIPGVVGVYVGALYDGTPCIGVMIVKKRPELKRKIPRVIEGYPVKIDETGEIRPLK